MAKTYACLLIGLDVVEVEIETIVAIGFSGLTILGLRSDITRDMRERVRAALESVGIPVPAKRVIVNISPQEILKLSRTPLQELDFAVAASIILTLFADQGIPMPHIDREFFAGELTLTGGLKTVQNILLYEKIINLNTQHKRFCVSLNFCHQYNHHQIFQNFESLSSWVDERKQDKTFYQPIDIQQSIENRQNHISDEYIQSTFATIKTLRKNPKACVAILIAVAGRHHILLAGEPGIGKSFAIQQIKNIFLPPCLDEKIEIKLIHSNKFDADSRPFRSPHHSSSTAALIGGQSLKPGEVTLAHHGILFLDEIAEFSRHTLDALREPLDSGRVELSKTAGNISYPAKFLLCATTNPCPCGYFLSFHRTCQCKPTDSRQYISKISGPLLDRFCLQVWMENPNSFLDQNQDIFSNYIVSLNDDALYSFTKNFLHAQTSNDSNENTKIIKINSDIYTSLRAQNKIEKLHHTFSKIFPSLSNENNFTDDILKYRNLQQVMNKVQTY